MLSPRRFVEHKHGPIETNTCNWGFDPNNWHYYIRLARSQCLNNLKQEQLQEHLQILKLASPILRSERLRDFSTPATFCSVITKIDEHDPYQRMYTASEPPCHLCTSPINYNVHSHNQSPSKHRRSASDDEPIRLRQNKHMIEQSLVATLDEVPTFITIEGQRVAAYSIGGEPHLCLPQLLENLNKLFDLQTLVEKFEECVSNFVAASPRQINGFITACCLSPNTKSCHMIKRSDAENVCLELYELLFQKLLKNSSQRAKYPMKALSSTPNKEQNDCIDDRLHSEKANSNQHVESSLLLDLSSNAKQKQITQYDGDSLMQSYRNTTPCNSVTESPTKSTNKYHGSESLRYDTYLQNLQTQFKHYDKNLAQGGELASLSQEELTKLNSLFCEMRAQTSLMSLARAATSTLIVRIYHRCFGKCKGLFYPYSLLNSESKCIECETCHVLLSPRRFIGHKHGRKESNMCHWGFSSDNWRYYVRPCKRQTMNNLDDDEVLKHFYMLQAIPDMEQYQEEQNLSTAVSTTSRTSDSHSVQASEGSDYDFKRLSRAMKLYHRQVKSQEYQEKLLEHIDTATGDDDSRRDANSKRIKTALGY